MQTFKQYWKVVVLGVLVVSNAVFVGYIFSDSLFALFAHDEYAQVLEDFSEVPPQFDTVGKFFLNIANERGAVYAFEILKRAQIPPNIDIHLVGHLIGDELYKQQGIEGMKYCTHDFRNACSHTVVIGALLEDGLSVLDQVHDVCKKAPGGSGAYTMCFHGFGHGVLAYTEYDVADATELCRQVGTKEFSNREYHECAGGITMEMVSGIHDPDLWAKKRLEYVREDDPLALCKNDAFPDDVKPMCYVYITPEIFTAAGADLNTPNPDTFKKAFSYCAALPVSEVSNREACFGGLGKEFVVLVQDRDIRKINETPDEKLARIDTWCALAGEGDGQQSCLTYALNSLYWGGENDANVSIRFCGLLSEDGNRTQCFEQLISNVSFFVRDSAYREHFCSALPDEFMSQCRARLQ